MDQRSTRVLRGDRTFRWWPCQRLTGGGRAVRSIIVVDIDRVQDSCGYAVPKMAYLEDRTRLDSWADNRSDDEIGQYQVDRNSISIDGLPALSE